MYVRTYFDFRFEYINLVFFASHWLAMSNSCYNPFIYAIYSVSTHLQFHLEIDFRVRKALSVVIKVLFDTT